MFFFFFMCMGLGEADLFKSFHFENLSDLNHDSVEHFITCFSLYLRTKQTISYVA